MPIAVSVFEPRNSCSIPYGRRLRLDSPIYPVKVLDHTSAQKLRFGRPQPALNEVQPAQRVILIQFLFQVLWCHGKSHSSSTYR